MELSIETLRLKNFQSVGRQVQEINLGHKGTTLILGENLDDGGSSGAGKSTIFTALFFVLFDVVPIAVSKDRLINHINDSKKTEMMVELTFRRGETKWVITRTRGALNSVKLLENGKDITPDSISNFNKKVEELIGFSYTLFSHLVLFRGKATPFLDLPVREQRELIEELIKITLLSRKAEALKLEIKDVERKIDIEEALVKQQRAINEQLDARIIQADQRAQAWSANQALEINRLTSLLEQAEALQLPCSEEDIERLNSIKDQIKSADVQLRDVERNLTAAGKTIGALGKEREHLKNAKCPYCFQGFSSESKLNSVEEELQECIANAEALRPQRDELLSKLEELKLKEAELTAHVNIAEYKRIKLALAEVPVLVEKLNNTLEAVNPHEAALQELASSSLTDVSSEKLNSFKVTQSHQAMLLKLLTDKNSYIRKGIISKTLPFINKRVGYYTERLGLPHIVLFQPDLSCLITQHGRELDHGNLSNGEKTRLNLSLCLAFRDALTLLHQKINLLLTDEVDAGSLDEQAVGNMITLLKHKAWDDKLSIFIISHRPEFEGRCDNNLIVRKESGFSTVIQG